MEQLTRIGDKQDACIMPFMAGRQIGFMHPPFASFPSGGNVYNEKLLEYAGRCGYPLVSLPWRVGAPCGKWDLLVWDSLFMDRLARIADERLALLLHYLPSLEPELDFGARQMVTAVEHRAITQADFAIATGECVANTVTARWPGKPVFVCEPGVSEMFLRNRPRNTERTVKLLTVAHLLPAKGHAQLLKLLVRLRHLQWHWHIAGDCGVSSETTSLLRNRAALAGLTERITFHGAVSQEAVAALMADSDILVCPSAFEAYGMTVAEAAASGLPVLSNRVGAAEQLIQHGVTGFLATRGDWDSLGRYLELLLEDATLRATFRHNLRHAAVRSWKQTCADFRAVCDAMLR
jgi:glycosyltransferase involved in cell wall biosynthesis